MDPPAADANIPNSPNSSNMYPPPNSAMSRFLRMSTAADALPMILNAIVTDGKMSCLAFWGVYIILTLLWLPFWLMTFLIGEMGVYALTIAGTFFIGRVVIRLIAFPGASHRVSSEIEVEFARYSVRMIQVAANCVIELCSALLPMGANSSSARTAHYDIPALWKRTQSYRDRVLGVYVEVLGYLYKSVGEDSAFSVTTSHGNNPIAGDIGNLASMTSQARDDGRAMVMLLRRIVGLLTALEQQVAQSGSSLSSYADRPMSLSGEAQATVRSLMSSATELRDVVSSFKPAQSPGEDDTDQEHTDDMDEEADASMEAVRRHLEKESDSMFDVLKGSLGAIIPLLDPQPHSSVFGLDVLRGCVLSRYRGARQIWVKRPAGGKLDVLHIPADSSSGSSEGRNRKAVLYCNPNAGLIEVATGMSLAGGNVSPEDVARNESWTDFYTQNGFDVYLFNYAGFGRSHGPTFPIPRFLSCIGSVLFFPGILGCCTRFFCSTFFSFKPTPGSLRVDAAAMGKYVITEAGVDKLVIHGESIGGMAASGAAKTLSRESVTQNKLALLVCDRTFCNLEAVAQRLVGSWTGPAIRALTPFWSTDVASDFAAADVPKVIANDSEDAIIADASSLKSGLSLSREIRRGASTKGVGWMADAPLEYRMADWENVGVADSKHAAPPSGTPQSPSWPADKFISLQEAFHFAACARRIGKVATAERRARRGGSYRADEEEGFEANEFAAPLVDDRPVEQGLVGAWKMLACCDGLSGSTLGVAVKNGFDCTVSWLCCTVTFGGQVITSSAQRRTGKTDGQIIVSDFDCRPAGYQTDESEMMVHPKPIPEVIETLKRYLESDDSSVKLVETEIKFCIGMLEYVVARLSSEPSVGTSRRSLDLQDNLGAFIELHCGHNSPFSAEERVKLQIFLDRATLH